MTQRRPGMDPAWRDAYLELGVLVVAAGQLESVVRTALIDLVAGANPRRSQLVIDGYSGAQMVERCRRLAHEVLSGSLQLDCLQWLDDVQKAQAQRNAIVHSDWSGGATTGTADGVQHGVFAHRFRVRKASRGLEYTTVTHTADSIAEVSSALVRAQLRGLNLVVEFQDFWRAEGVPEPPYAPKWRRVSDPSPTASDDPPPV